METAKQLEKHLFSRFQLGTFSHAGIRLTSKSDIYGVTLGVGGHIDFIEDRVKRLFNE